MKWKMIEDYPLPDDGSAFLFATDDSDEMVFVGTWRSPSFRGVVDQPCLLYLSYTNTSAKNLFRHGGFIKCGLRPIKWMSFPRP